MNQLHGTLLIIWLEIKRNFAIFFTVLLSIVVMTTILSITGVLSDIFVNTNIPLLVYTGLLGAQLYRLTFQYGISFGVTRRNFYIGAITGVVFMSFLLSVIHNIIYFSVKEVLTIFSVNLDILNINSYMINETISNFLWIDFTLCLFVLSSSMIFSIIWYRFGLVPLYITFGVLFMTAIFPFTLEFWKDLFSAIFGSENVLSFSWFILVSLVLFAAAFPMVHTMDQYAKDKGAA